jgi:hypothetical protein
MDVPNKIYEFVFLTGVPKYRRKGKENEDIPVRGREGP